MVIKDPGARRTLFVGLLIIMVLASTLTPGGAPPAQAQVPPDPRPAGTERPNPAANTPPATPPPERILPAAEAHVTQDGSVYRWTQDTRADWETGTWENLDGATVSGTLRLEQRWFGDSHSITPEEQLAHDQGDPAIAVGPDGTLYAVWADERNGDSDIYFARSTDGGQTWSANVRVNDDPGAAQQQMPALAVDESEVLYAVWGDSRNGDGDIYFARSTDGGQTWSANVRVNDDPGSAQQRMPALAVDESGTLYAVWEDGRNGDGDIYFARSTDEGQTWSANMRVNDDPGAAWQGAPALAIDGNGILYAVWMDKRDSSGLWWRSDIYFARSDDSGQTWSANVRVNDDPDAAIWWSPPALAVDGDGTLYAVWVDERNDGEDPDIYFARSTDGGVTWSANVRVNDKPGWAGWWSPPALTVDEDGILYAVWSEYCIYFARSDDGGQTWSAIVGVDDDYGVDPGSPALTVDGDGTLYTVWRDERNHGDGDIYFARSTDGGTTWSANIRVNDDPCATGQGSPALAVDGDGTLYAVWEDKRNGNNDPDIYFARSTDGGQTWGTNVRVDDDSDMVYEWPSPALAVGPDGTLYVVWEDERNSDGDLDIYFARSTDGGATWSANVRVNDDPGAAWQSSPALAVDESGVLYTVWGDSRNGDGDIYFARSADGGMTWNANVRVNDDSGSAGQGIPALAAGPSGVLYAVWVDQRNGDADIYFARSTDGGTTWSANIRVNDDPSTAWQYFPALTVGRDGTIYAVWEDNRTNGGYDTDIYIARSTDGGQTWSANVRVDDDPGAAGQEVRQESPSLAVDGDGTLYAVWTDGRNGFYNPDIYFSRSTDGGTTWSANVRVDDDPGTAYQYSHALAVDGNGALYTAWTDERYGWHIRVARFLSTPEYYPAGRYTSPVFDAGVPATWQTLAWQGILPTGTAFSFESRTRMPGGDWSDWYAGSGYLSVPPGQYFQYRVTLTTSAPNKTSALEWIEVAYRAVDVPSAPRFATPCGVTNQYTPTLTGSAAAGSVVHLYVDGVETLTTTTNAEGTFALSPALAPGSRTLTAAAENEHGLGPVSAGLALTVSPTLAYDPLGVRAGQWSKDGWLLAPPRDDQGCADPTNGWQVWPRAGQRFYVEVPVSYTVSAAVSVTVGVDTITLTEVTTGTFVGVFEPPISAGAFRIEVVADGQRTVAEGGPVLIDPDGVVYEAMGTLSDTISGVEVTLYYSDTHTGLWLPWDAWNYDQVNPQVTLADGYYSFYTPPGVYRVAAEKEGYPAYVSPDLVVVDRPVRHNVPLGERKWEIYLPLVLRGW